MIHLVLGGARSGKSRHAEALAASLAPRRVYLATAQAGDDEMARRIQQHRADRSADWQTIEEPVDLAGALTRVDAADSVVLIDCLTLWLSNCLTADNWPAQRDAFIAALPRLEANIVMVSNEVGSGIVPLGELSRVFVDESGRLHQEMAVLCETATLLVAGLPLTLK